MIGSAKHGFQFFLVWLSLAGFVPAARLPCGNLFQQRVRGISLFIAARSINGTWQKVQRLADSGGMDVNDAFSLSDSYIQQCELLASPEKLVNLQYRMLLDYTNKVERLRLGKQPTRLSRPYLSRRFKKETGESLTDFILKEKTEEAKRLLRYSGKSLTAIGNYLGFSSQSHFARVFKKYAKV